MAEREPWSHCLPAGEKRGQKQCKLSLPYFLSAIEANHHVTRLEGGLVVVLSQTSSSYQDGELLGLHNFSMTATTPARSDARRTATEDFLSQDSGVLPKRPGEVARPRPTRCCGGNQYGCQSES